jgi:hypothetical protein
MSMYIPVTYLGNERTNFSDFPVPNFGKYSFSLNHTNIWRNLGVTPNIGVIY